MAGHSKLVLRWEIDDAWEKLLTGRADSDEFHDGGYTWIAGVKEVGVTRTGKKAQFALRCVAGNRKCDADVELWLLRETGVWLRVHREQICFDGSNDVWMHESRIFFSSLSQQCYNINNKITAEFRINILNEEIVRPIVDPTKFLVPTSKSNVILLIGEVKLHVSKEFLATHSPVFDAMFFGEYAEKGKDEVEIKDVVCQEFVDLLHIIYPGRAKIMDSTVLHILALGDRFQMERVLDLAETYLLMSKRFTTVEKMGLADQYRFRALRDTCIHTFSTARELAEIESTSEYANFSADMKAAICDRLIKLVRMEN